MRVLVVEDESRLARLVRRGLAEEGHAVDLCSSGEDALKWVKAAQFDVIVLDIMLPGIDGLTVCRTLRQRRVQVPILMLTARDSVPDRVAGLDAGADDYLVKPFAFTELAARLRALTRRPPTPSKPFLKSARSASTPPPVWCGATARRSRFRTRSSGSSSSSSATQTKS